MHRYLAFLALAVPATSVAAEATDDGVKKSKIPAISLLPDGGELTGFMHPRYDEQRKLVAVLRSAAVTVVNPQQIAGKSILVELFNPDQSPRGKATLQEATFYQESGLLKSDAPVTIQTERVNASGSGLHYLLDTGKGFMRGPATTLLKKKPSDVTAMNLPINPARMTAMFGVSMLAPSVLAAAPPPPISAEQRAALEADSAPRAAAAAAAREGLHETLKTDLTDGLDASAAALAFLAQAEIAAPDTAEHQAPDKPLDANVDAKKDTLIESDGGFYFDSKEGVLVYLKNVRVTDPRFDLKGANELKVFFGKRAAEDGDKKPNETPPKDKLLQEGMANLAEEIGDVERIVATGAILITQKPAEDSKEDPIQASGAVFTYNVGTGQAILTGGFPWVTQGASRRFRALEPHGILNIQVKSSSFVTEGKWDTMINFENLDLTHKKGEKTKR
jgi:lipopolysaccharide export system protein LptA